MKVDHRDAWDPMFFRRSRLFWPVGRAARALGEHSGWPTPDDLTRLFEGEPPVRFEPASPRRRRARVPADARYDARIALSRRVPTRPRSWHDLTNALVWATFPRAKLALHVRQHGLVAARLGSDLRLPGARTREHDAVAMFDEGGLALLCARAHRPRLEQALRREVIGDLASLSDDRAVTALVFGHAIYEALARGGAASFRCLARIVEVDAVSGGVGERVRAADEAIEALLSRDDPLGRDDFVSVPVDERLAAAEASFAGNPGVATEQHPPSAT
jgi:hypothetical protein